MRGTGVSLTVTDGLPKLTYTNKDLSLQDFRGDAKMYKFYLQTLKAFNDYENRMQELNLIKNKNNHF